MNRKLILCIAGSGLLLLGLGIITPVSHFYPEHLNNSEIFLSQKYRFRSHACSHVLFQEPGCWWSTVCTRMSAHTSGLLLSLVGFSKDEKNPFVIFRFTFMKLTPSYIVILKNSHIFFYFRASSNWWKLHDSSIFC